MMKAKRKILTFVILPILMVSIVFFGFLLHTHLDKDKNKVEILLGIVQGSDNMKQTFESRWDGSVSNKTELVEVLESGIYEKYNGSFLESEALCIHFEDTDETVWYAAEYSTDELYAIYDGQMYKVKNSEEMFDMLGKYVGIDQHFVMDISMYKFNFTVLENGSKIDEVGTCTLKRYFYNPKTSNPNLVTFNINDVSETKPELADVKEVCDIAAKAAGLEVYKAYPYRDKYTSGWYVELIDEIECQKFMSETEEGAFAFYDKCWHFYIKSNGEIVYCLFP